MARDVIGADQIAKAILKVCKQLSAKRRAEPFGPTGAECPEDAGEEHGDEADTEQGIKQIRRTSWPGGNPGAQEGDSR